MHTVLLLDDHDIIRFGLSSLLTASDEFRVISQCATLDAAGAAISELKPDLVIGAIQRTVYRACGCGSATSSCHHFSVDAR